jgi:hypothetical protein
MTDDRIREVLLQIYQYTGENDDWLVVKKLFLNLIPPRDRRHFSTRDSKTYTHTMNDFERKVVNVWKEITGSELVLKRKETVQDN